MLIPFNFPPFIFLFILFFVQSNFLFCQNWQSVDSGVAWSGPPEVKKLFVDTINDLLYARGNFTKAGNIPVCYVAQWNGTKWDSVVGVCPFSATGFIRFNNNLFAASGNGTTGNIIKWNGTNWIIVATFTGFNGAWGFCEYNNELYAYGGFDTINGIPASNIAKYNGSTWSAIDTTKWYAGFITCAIIYQGELYIGGNMRNWNGTIDNLAKWSGTQWLPVGNNAMAGGMSGINCFEIYNGDLYMGGLFYQSTGNPSDGIARWNGTQWLDVGGGIGQNPAQIFDMKVYNGELWVGGNFSETGGIPALYISKWDGTNWCSFGDTLSNGVLALEIYKNELYIGGGFLKINSDTMNYISKWIGGGFTDTCGNTSAVNENNFSDEINIFPNPTSGEFQIQLASSQQPAARIEIYNVYGEKVYSSVVSSKSSVGQTTNNYPLSTNIDLRSAPNGIYFLHLSVQDESASGGQTENRIAAQKLIIQK